MVRRPLSESCHWRSSCLQAFLRNINSADVLHAAVETLCFSCNIKVYWGTMKIILRCNVVCSCLSKITSGRRWRFVPNVTYQFQAVAWEEIGIIGRVDCNKSPPVHQGPNRARLQVSARAVHYLQSLRLAKKGKIEAMMSIAKAGDKVWCLPKSCNCHNFPIIAVYDFERMYKYSNIFPKDKSNIQ